MKSRIALFLGGVIAFSVILATVSIGHSQRPGVLVSGSYTGVFTPGSLSADRTYTFSDNTGTVVLGTGADNRVPLWNGTAGVVDNSGISQTSSGISITDTGGSNPMGDFTVYGGVYGSPYGGQFRFYNYPGDTFTINYEDAAVQWTVPLMLLSLGTSNTAMDGEDDRVMFRITRTGTIGASGEGNVLNAAELLGPSLTPNANTREAGLFVNSGFDISVSTEGPVFQRQNFLEPMRVIPDTFDDTTPDLLDGEVNFVSTANGIQFEYREEQNKTTSSMIFNGAGAIDISADDTTDNEGVEIYLGSSANTTTGYLIVGTNELCFSVRVDVALIAGTDQFVIGWRENAAYEAANIYANYTEYAVIGINNVDGSVFALQENGDPATASDDSGTNWSNGQEATLTTCIDGDGNTEYYFGDTVVTDTNTDDFALTSGTVMNPFISYMQAGGAVDPAITILWWEIHAKRPSN
jgi:hypothetical protein